MAILAAGVLAIINPVAQFGKARDAKRKSDLSQIEKALETFYQDNGKYPDTVSFKIMSTKGDNSAADWGTNQWAPYMSTLPKDPSGSRNYVYYSPTDTFTGRQGQSYYLYASLEGGANDSQACNKGNACVSLTANNLSGTVCGTGVPVCNYGISSPNVSP